MADKSRVHHGAVSRRSGRTYTEDHDGGGVELANVGPGQSSNSSESRYGSGDERTEREKVASRQNNRSSSGSASSREMGDRLIPVVDLGRDVRGLFPPTLEEMGKHVIKSLQAAKSNAKVEGRPLNFGTIIPGAIYRSSFPTEEDHEFLSSLDLKTVLTLVKKDYPPEFLPFLKANGISHFIVDMKGTKKVAIPEDTMHSILELALDKANHPLLIHCNHGKHRTGCAAAVIRHISGWDVKDIIEEYSNIAEPKIRECDLKYITEYEVASLEGLFHRRARASQESFEVLEEKKVHYFLLGCMFLAVCIIITLLLHR